MRAVASSGTLGAMVPELGTLTRLAAGQHGVFSLAQAAEYGLDSRWVARAVRSGRLRRLSSAVLAVDGAPETRGLRAMAAVLDAGHPALLNGGSALAWWGVAGFDLDPVHVVRRYGNGSSRRSSLGVVHATRDLPEALTTRLDGVPIVRPELALLQAARFLHPGRLERAVDTAWAMRLVDGRALHRVLRG